MRKFLTSLFAFIFLGTYTTGQTHFQQSLSYNMDVSLTEERSHLVVSMDIVYTNNSSITLDTLFFHLWANAFKNKSTPFAQQRLEMMLTDFYFATEKDMGGYESLEVDCNEGIKSKGYKDQYEEILFVIPNKPLASGKEMKLTFNYTLKLPKFFSRMGIAKDGLFFTHWYPRPAVFDHEGWHTFPYLSMGEFYGEFGNYSCNIHLPEESKIVSTGTEVLKAEYDNIRTFIANDVIDFAWFVNDQKSILQRKLERPNGKKINLNCLCDDDEKWHNALNVAAEFIDFMSEKVGEYPYPQLTIVQGPASEFTSMEYPQIVVIDDVTDPRSIDYYIAHEIAHNWFYAILANNERKHFWIDEGLATYYEHQFTLLKTKKAHYDNITSKWITNGLEMPLMQTAVIGQHARCLDQVMNTPIGEYALTNYGLNAYEQSATAFNYLSEYVGKSNFDNLMQELYKKYKFKHIGPQQIRDHFENQTGKDLSWFFDGWMGDKGEMDYALKNVQVLNDELEIVVENRTALKFPFTIDQWENGKIIKSQWEEGFLGIRSFMLTNTSPESISIDGDAISLDINRANNHRKVSGLFPALEPISLKPIFAIDNSRLSEIYYLPLFGYNYNDGFLPGFALYNSSFPPKKIQFLLAPFYGIESKAITGYGHLNISDFISHGKFKKWSLGLALKSFHFDVNERDDYRLRYVKIDPSFSLDLRQAIKDRIRSKISVKTTVINQQFASFSGPGEFDISNQWSFIPSLHYQWQKTTALSSSKAKINLEFQSYDIAQTEHNYLKMSASYRQAYKIAPSKSLDFRIFGSYFLLNSQRRSTSFNNIFSRGSSTLFYQGFNDYTFDESFLSRGRSDSFISRQISMEEGGFKNALGSAYNIGMTNDFSLALNVRSDLPFSLPKFLPLKVYFDVGMYTRFPDISSNAERNILYSGGLLISFANEIIEVYFPLYSHEEISNIYRAEQMDLFKKISFSINLNSANPWKTLDYNNF